jgi:hypothetical protein
MLDSKQRAVTSALRHEAHGQVQATLADRRYAQVPEGYGAELN